MKRKIHSLFWLAATLAVSLQGFIATPVQAAVVEPGFEVETVAEGFVLPTAMSFSPDGRIFVAEKGGSVKVVENGVVLPQPLITLTDINTFGDRGLIGMALDPNFQQNGYLYLSYTFENSPGIGFGSQKTGRIVRVTVNGNVASESSKVVLVGTVGGNAANPSCENFPVTSDCIASDSSSHSVGGLRFGPDGKLYATLGDGADFSTVDARALRAQNLDSLAGKVLRINTDGSAPQDNPFFTGNPSDNRSKVFAYGLRNSFRLNFKPGTNSLFAGEVGWSNWEEVNRITAGANYGWPCWEGNSLSSYNCTPSGVTLPTYTYAHNASGAGSITVGAFPTNGAYPASYNNSMFIGDYAQNWIKRVNFDNNNNVSSVTTVIDGDVWPVDMSTGVDGTIYYLDIAFGSLNRITHTTGNRKPVVQVSAVPTSGLAPLQVVFSSEGTIDPDGNPISYSWNFGDGSNSTEANPTHTYTGNGTYIASITVTDSLGAQSIKSITITVGNQAPSANITNPLSGSLYVPNQIIQLNGTATDPEDGVLPPSAYHWQVILHHNTHIHYMQDFLGVQNPSFVADDHNDPTVYMEIILTVTDSAGLTSTQSANIYVNNGNGSGNLIANPSVEAESALPNHPESWHQGWFGQMNPIFTYPVAGFEGEKAMKLEITSYTSGDAKWYFDPVSVSPGQQYEFSNYYTATVPTELMIQFGYSNGTYSYQFLDTLPAVTSPTQVVKTFTVPEGAQTMVVFHQMAQVGELVTDNFSLTLAQVAEDTTLPTVLLTSPADNATLNGNVQIEATANDNVGVAGVTFKVDGVTLGSEDLTAPYAVQLDTTTITNGQHTISAVARDTSGNNSISSTITVTVDNQAVTPTNLIVNGDFETANGTNPLGWSPLGWGSHARTFTYPVTGRDGNKAARVEITSYLPGDDGDARWVFDDVNVTPGETYTFSDYYKANTISDVIGRYTMSDGSYYYFGLIKEIQPTSDWTFQTKSFTVPVGATKVTLLHLISSVGFLETDDASLILEGSGTPPETEAPVVNFTNPLNGATVSGIITLAANATDNVGIASVHFSVNGTPFGPHITTAPYELQFDTATLPNGTHTLKVTADDAVGNNAAEIITVTVNNIQANSLILNPSLETLAGANPANWNKGGWGTNDRTFTFPVAGQDGSNAARVEITNFTNGDAKWYFDSVAVTSGQLYSLKHYYKSSVSTNLTIRYTMQDGSFQYSGQGDVPASSDWVLNSLDITPPAGAVAVTLFHSLISAGWLEIDNYTLTSGSTQTFDKGKVSLTFDDGWISHYTEALPVLNAENVKGGFYIITQETLNAVPTELLTNGDLETAAGNGDPAGWKRGGWGTNDRVLTYPSTGNGGGSAVKAVITNYTSGDAKWYFDEVDAIPDNNYTITGQYNSTASTEILIRYTLDTGAVQYAFVQTAPSTSGVWQNYSFTFKTPADVVSFTMFHILAQVGELSLDNISVKRDQVFVDVSQVLAMQAAGHEVGSHTQTHPYLTTVSPAQQQLEIVQSKQDLLAMGVNIVDTMVYPYGDYDASVMTQTQNAGYIGGRSVDRGYNLKSTNKYALKIQQVDRTTTITDIQNWTQEAANNNQWLILMFHQINGDLTADLGATPVFLQQIVQYIKTQNVDIITMREGLGLMN